MSGHNKWSKVKNFKGALDAKRGKLFTKLTKEIIVASQIGGGNPDGNARLRQAIVAARSASMPKENIERAIKRGTGELASERIEEMLYEGYGPQGVAVIVTAATDNRNRTVSDLRNLFKSHGGALGESGSVSWMFQPWGQLLFSASQYPEEALMNVALEAGASDIQTQDDHVVILCAPQEIGPVRAAFERAKMVAREAKTIYAPKSTVPVTSEDVGKQLFRLLEAIEDHDDVQQVYSNFEMEDALFQKLS